MLVFLNCTQFPVDTPLLEELFVVSTFGDLAFMYDYYFVSMLDSAQPVGNHERSSVFHQIK